MTIESLDAPPPLPPPRYGWRQLWSGAAIFVSHLVAAATAWIILLLLSAITAICCAATMTYNGLVALDGPPPPFLPFIGVAILVILLVAGAVASTLVALLLALLGIAADIARRFLHFPRALVPPVLFLVALGVWSLVERLQGTAGASALRDALVGSLLLATLFCLYWIPLALSVSILLFATRFLDRIEPWLPGSAYRKWRGSVAATTTS